MPGTLLKDYTSQADWQSGTLENLDAVSVPGAIVPSGDFTRTFDTQVEFNAGTYSNTAASTDGKVALVRNVDRSFENADTGSVNSPRYLKTYWIQRISVHGLLKSFTVKAAMATSSYISQVLVELRKPDWTMLKYVSVTSTVAKNGVPADLTLSNINLELDEEVFFIVSTIVTNTANYLVVETSDEAPEGAVGTAICHDNTGGSDTVIAAYLHLHQTVARYAASGTWVSPWIAHGVASPYAGWLKSTQVLPAGCSLSWEVRHSADGGATFGDWLPLEASAKVPGTVLTHIQVRASLATTDDQYSPKVDVLWLCIGPIHRWASPALDVSGRGDVLMLVPSAASGLDLAAEAKFGAGDWSAASAVFARSGDELYIRLILVKTDPAVQSLGNAAVWEAVDLKMMGEPQVDVRPPEVTDVICYVEGSDPLIEVSSSLGASADKRVEVRVSVPAGSTQDYAQDYADAYLAVHGREQLSVTCKVPLATRLSFGELVAVAIPYLGYTREAPWLARVQRKTHRPLAGPPHTELVLGDFLPQDEEVLVRLLSKVEGG